MGRNSGAERKVKSVLHMELFLNLAWLLLAGALLGLWLQREVRPETGRRRQLIAIAVLIAILFPVISVSDDLLTVQTAFEADNYQRRDHVVPSNNYPVPPALTIIAAVILAELGFGPTRLAPPSAVPVHVPEYPEWACVGNRPPPLA